MAATVCQEAKEIKDQLEEINQPQNSHLGVSFFLLVLK